MQKYDKINKNFLFLFFANLIIFEIVLGGGGRLLEYGGITLRMVLFSISLIFFMFVTLYKYTIEKRIVIFLLLSMIYLSFGLTLGVYNNSLKLSLVDLKPQLFLLLILFLSLVQDIESKFIKAVKVAALIMSFLYLVVFFVMNSGLIPFSAIYLINDTGEFFFRGENGFVYKGFVYVLLGAIIFYIQNEYSLLVRYVIIIFLLISIYFTYSRGLLITFFLVISFYHLIDKNILSKIKFIVFLSLIPLFGFIYLSTFSGRSESDSSRLNDLYFLYNHFDNFYNIIWGKGFGSFINGRPMIEYSLLDIFYKTGILGVFFWLGIYAYIYVGCIKEKSSNSIIILMLTTAIYIQSFFNPYLNNPIGILVVLVGICFVSRQKYVKN